MLTIKKIVSVGIITLISLIGSTLLNAAPNPLINATNVKPNITAITKDANTGTVYNTTGGSLTVDLTVDTVDYGSGPMLVGDPILTINASIDSTGAFSGGTFSIVTQDMTTILLSGSIDDYGIADFNDSCDLSTDRVDFLGTAVDGTWLSDFGGTGTEIYASVILENSNYGPCLNGLFGNDWSSNPSKISQMGPTPQVTPSDGTGTIGYWKNHPEDWFGISLSLGGITYNQDTLIDFLGMAVKGDKTIAMAKQLIAAKLNVLAGNDDSCISSTIDAADNWLALNGPVGAGVRKWGDGDLMHDDLDEYNNGKLCAPHRD